MDDKALRKHIIDELDYDPSIDASQIGIAVNDGVVTLTGHVPNYAQKYMAERAVQRVKGVCGIAEELKVDFGAANPYRDEDIARRALAALDQNVLVPEGAIMVKVQQGWLTLTGEVEWDYQRTAALADLRKLRGVTGIANSITLKPCVVVADLTSRIREALKRNAELEAAGVKVSVDKGKVRLEGHVPSWADRHAVERAVWAAPGVGSVEDNLYIS